MKLKDLLKEDDIPQGPGWEMARALNSLANDIGNSKHDKQLKWAEKNETKANAVVKAAEELKKLVYKMR
jgi:hypothetical protein